MFKKILVSFPVLSLALSAQETESPQPIESPQQIQLEINTAQHDFEIAQKMFLPYYTGPLITGSANNVPPGQFLTQPYIYFTINHAVFNKHRKSVRTPNTYVFSPLIVLETGITRWMDFTVVPSGFFRWKQSRFGDGFGDLPVQLGFQLAKETPYIPSIRFIVGEQFPTGKYKHLSPHKEGLDATGSGTYETIVGLNVSKVFWWLPLHPVAIRMASNYLIPDNRAHVRSFNAYGGGHGTDGRVRVGQTFNIDIGVEVSLTQKWVIANDFAYTHSNKSKFAGKPGTTVTGTPAANGAPSSDNFSIAPAIEYNINGSNGFIGGVWFSVTGRNSANFISVVLSYCGVF